MRKTLRIYLARHGQDEDNAAGILNGRRDMPLTALGLEQAQVLAEKIRSLELSIGEVFSSPLQRAYTTAKTVTDMLEIAPPQKVDLLIERELGVMTGTPIQDIEKSCAPHILKTNPVIYFLSGEDVETFPQLHGRAGEALVWLEKNAVSESVLVVAHGDIGKMLYASFYGLGWEEVLKQFHFGNSDVLLLEKGTPLEERHVHRVAQYNQ